MSDLDEYLEYCRERDAWEDAQERLEAESEEKANSDFSVIWSLEVGRDVPCLRASGEDGAFVELQQSRSRKSWSVWCHNGDIQWALSWHDTLEEAMDYAQRYLAVK